ncbi:MAG: FAD:protein FMN transferase [Acidimicrobiales bacterium]
MTNDATEPVDTHRPVVEDRWHAMGTQVHVVVVGGDRGHLALARNRIDTLERRWSRFRHDSEVSRLNAAQGEPLEVSADTALLVALAQHAWRLTGGTFDPTLLHALHAAGYDRSFDEVRAGTATTPAVPARLPIVRPLVTDVDVRGHLVTFPAGLGFDAGGIGKGLAADLTAELLVDAGATGCCVNLGGDLRVIGAGPAGAGWTIAIDEPRTDEPVATVGLADGAVATSTALRRTWLSNGEPRHHLIDPVTGEPSASDVALASAIAGEAWLAEVLAKTALLRGTARAFDVFDRDTAGLVVDHAGRVRTSDGLARFTGGRTPTPLVVAA